MKTKGRKLTDLQIAERFQVGYEWIVYKRLSYTEFRSKFSKEFKITVRQAEIIWKQVKDTIKARFEDEQETLLENQIERYFSLLERSRENGNRRVEREILSDLTKLYGLEQSTKIDLTSGGEAITLNIVLDKD